MPQVPGPAPTPKVPPTSSGGGRGIVAVLAFAGITVAVMQTLLVPVIKDLPVLLGTGVADATWVMTATLLAGAVATPVMGRLGDLYGKKRLLLLCLAVMVGGSVLCALTSALVPMIVGRALQGFAMGAIPLGIGIMRDVLPAERLPSAMALMSSSIGVGGGLALPAAALIAQHADWHALFVASAVLGTAAFTLAWWICPESPVRAEGRFDLPGAVGLAAGLICLLLPVTKGTEWGWTAPATLGLFGAGLLVLTGWGLYQLRSSSPLVDLRTSVRRTVLLTNLASVMLGVAFYAVSLVLPQLVQLPTATGYGLGESMIVAGLCMAPLGLTMMLVSPLYARLSTRYGPRSTLLLGMAVIMVGYGGGQALLTAAWQTAVIAAVLGAGIGLAYSSLPALIIGAVDPRETGAANGLNTLMRSVGTSLSSAVIGMVLAGTAVPFGGVELPSMTGFRLAFLIATGAVAVGVVLAFFLPSGLPARAEQALTAPLGEPAAPREDPYALTGRVRDAGGVPVAHANVTLLTPGGVQTARTTADEAGAFRLTAPGPGRHLLVASASGHTPQAVPVHTGGATAPAPVELVTGQARAGAALAP
ncbi:MFS transporter [Streptomyces albidoflavus]|uniref:MFS transporter n=1 Tax=Streptomyces albidoflavus TaxID=1886 RepID=A0A8G1ZN94_9ACTN|nr:MFS transporter [Streptomyces albidoflavus]KUL62155.1 transporter [Streptomyces albidoflavus]RZE19089.1 MFS transporter [Streptomyces albidoflavus]WSU17935.1 MFS transporter [Streptomyces albidoflavus]WTC32086.1 MFS transporter [Streptomyces albidoflavus]